MKTPRPPLLLCVLDGFGEAAPGPGNAIHLAAPRFWLNGDISHGMYIEMKVAGGRVKPHQKAIHERLRARGYHVIVAWSAREAIEAIARYLDIEHGLDNNWRQ